MNGILANILISMFILRHWQGRNGLKLWFLQCQSLLKNLESRTYDFEQQNSSENPEAKLFEVFGQSLRKGRLRPAAIRSLMTWIRRLEQGDAERRRQGLSAVFRLGLASCLALSTSLYLDRSWTLDLYRNPPALILLVSQALFAAIWLKRLPGHCLATSLELRIAFTQVWMGEDSAGPWQKNLEQLMKRAWQTGRDPSDERQFILEDWLLLTIDEQEKRRTWAEELFGLVELAGSVYFLGTACTLPLLQQLGG